MMKIKHFIWGLVFASVSTYATTSIISGNESVALGHSGTFAVPVTMTAQVGEKPVSLQFDVLYDDTQLSYESASTGTQTTAAGKDIYVNQRGTDTVRVLIFGLNNNVIEDGEIIVLSFSLAGTATAGTTSLDIDATVVTDSTGPAIPSADVDGSVTILAGVRVQTKLLLEGLYDAGSDEMVSDTVAASSPYAADARTVDPIPSDIVDWVLIELRSTIDGAAVASMSALLRNDGCVTADDGTTEYIAMATSAGDYFVVIFHRNHLAIASANEVTLSSSSSTLYNFTTNTTQCYGESSELELETDVWGMYAGDIDQDGEVAASDYTVWYSDALAGDSGYQTSDVNGDGEVTTADYVMWYNNVMIGVGSFVP